MSYAMERLFGRQKNPPVVLSAQEEKANGAAMTQEQMVNLQGQIDQMNGQITQWETQKKTNKTRALAFKQKNQVTQCKQLLAQNHILDTQINAAMSAVALLMQKQGSLSVSTMLTGTHSTLVGVNKHIKENNKTIDIDEFQTTLADNEMLDEDLNEISQFMNVSTPLFNNASDLDKEFDQLSEEVSESDYDYPSVVTNNTTNNTNSVASSTKSSTTTTTTPKQPLKRTVLDDLF